jgi:hypothetical protein
VALGASARPAGADRRAWLRTALEQIGARRQRHPGTHRYVWRLGRNQREREQIKLGVPTQRPYPKQADPEPIRV